MNKKTCYTDPRLAFAKTTTENQNKPLSKMSGLLGDDLTASEILKSRDLSGQYAIVTGANRGLGM